MTPTLLNLTIFQGVAFDPGDLIYNDANGNAVNITGWNASAQIRVDPCGPVVIDLAPTISNGAAGKISLAKNSAQTTNFTSIRGGWDLVLTAPNSERYGPIYAGRAACSQLHTHQV